MSENQHLLHANLSPKESLELLIDANITYHKMKSHKLLASLESSMEGLSHEVVIQKRLMEVENVIPGPVENDPSWMCCIAPFIGSNSDMHRFNEILPTLTKVKRKGRSGFINMESNQILPGDIVSFDATQSNFNLIPADIRIIDCSDCTINNIEIFGNDGESLYVTSDASHNTSYIESLCMVFAGSKILSGRCEGVVVQTGKDTLLSKLIKNKKWPVPVNKTTI
jgi:hypothetical protein